MIFTKTEEEIKLIRKSAKILCEVRSIIAKKIKPGMKLITLDRIAEKEIKKRNAKSCFMGYEGFPRATCMSVNNVVIHGIPDNYKLKEGDILSLDMGVNYKGWHSDSARTYAVGNISDEARKLLDRTNNALSVGASVVRSGINTSEIGIAIENYLKPFGYGIVEDYTGHGIGKSLHEEPQILNYDLGINGDILPENCVICIEPMVNLGTKEVITNDWDVRTKDGKISAHFEDMILVLKDSYEILTLDVE